MKAFAQKTKQKVRCGDVCSAPGIGAVVVNVWTLPLSLRPITASLRSWDLSHVSLAFCILVFTQLSSSGFALHFGNTHYFRG